MNTKTLLYIGKRILLAILTVWVVITVTFFVMHAIPGGPFQGEKAITPAVQQALEEKYGLGILGVVPNIYNISRADKYKYKYKNKKKGLSYYKSKYGSSKYGSSTKY